MTVTVRERPLVAAITALLLVGGLPLLSGPAQATTGAAAPVTAAPAGDVPAAPMTRPQARRLYIAAICPTDAAIAALTRAEADPAATWSRVQPLVRDVGRQQLRTARLLTHPARPWPASLRDLIPGASDLFVGQSGANEVLAAASNLATYRALLESLQANLSPELERLVETGMADLKSLRTRLGLPASGGCPTT